MTRHIEIIGEILDTAAEMPADLRDDLHQALFAALAFVGARHHQRIENQLREAARVMREKMN
jgi:hypothetical protein